MYAQLEVEFGAGHAARARAIDHDPRAAQILACDCGGVQQRRAADDRRAVLVVMKYRDVHPFLEFFLDVEALRRLDVLKVHAAEGRLEQFDDADDLLRIRGVDFKVEHVDVREALEEDALAFHDRLPGERADVAEAEHGGAIRDDGHQIGAGGVVGGALRVPHDLQAGLRDARRIGQAEVQLRVGWLGRRDRDLAGPRIAVIFEG